VRSSLDIYFHRYRGRVAFKWDALPDLVKCGILKLHGDNFRKDSDIQMWQMDDTWCKWHVLMLREDGGHEKVVGYTCW
jgi:hypothetical protein